MAAGITDPTAGNNSATDTDTLVPTADLSITKTDGATGEVPGTTVTYTIVAIERRPVDGDRGDGRPTRCRRTLSGRDVDVHRHRRLDAALRRAAATSAQPSTWHQAARRRSP